MSKKKQKSVLPAGRPGTPNPIDIHVGDRIRLRRSLLGMTQHALAEALGLTFQQVQKYEHGANRVSASRLYDISRILDTSIDFFFQDMPEEVIKQSPRLRAGLEDKEGYYGTVDTDPLSKKETLELVSAFYRIPSIEFRDHILGLCMAMARTQSTNMVLNKKNLQRPLAPPLPLGAKRGRGRPRKYL